MLVMLMLAGGSMPAVSAAGERQSPVVQQLGTYAEVAVRTPANALARFIATGPGWTPDLIAAPGTTFSSPRITEVNGNAHILVDAVRVVSRRLDRLSDCRGEHHVL
jgi:hypothetical protein